MARSEEDPTTRREGEWRSVQFCVRLLGAALIIALIYDQAGWATAVFALLVTIAIEIQGWALKGVLVRMQDAVERELDRARKDHANLTDKHETVIRSKENGEMS